MASIDHYLHALRAQFTDATKRGTTHIIINAGELCLDISLHATDDDLRRCEEALQTEMDAGDALVDEGEGRLTIRYALPRL